MTAQPVEPRGPDPDDILRRLPADHRDQFLGDYHAAVDAAHDTWRYRHLQEVLRLWHLRATACHQPDFPHRATEARTAEPGRFVPVEDALPGWPRPASP